MTSSMRRSRSCLLSRGRADPFRWRSRGASSQKLSLSARYPDTRLADMILPPDLQARLERVLHEQRQQQYLRDHGLHPRRKLLLVGPSVAGKTMTAAALAGELKLPLFSVVLDGLITKFMGETAAKLRLVFDAMGATRGVYFFDEFDAIGARRGERQDVGGNPPRAEFFSPVSGAGREPGPHYRCDQSSRSARQGALRRFDDVIEYALPDATLIERLLRARLDRFDTRALNWGEAAERAVGLPQAEIVRAARTPPNPFS